MGVDVFKDVEEFQLYNFLFFILRSCIRFWDHASAGKGYPSTAYIAAVSRLQADLRINIFDLMCLVKCPYTI